MRYFRCLLGTVMLVAAHADAIAQMMIGYNQGLIVPLIAETPSYQSQVYVHNPSASTVSVRFDYVGATSSDTPGMQICETLQIPAGNVVKTSLSALCPGISPGFNFGSLSTTFNGSNIALYARTQTPSGNGFSVEGVVDFSCCANVREVIGLVRQAAAPTYQTNCFIQNHETLAGRIVVTLATADGQPVAAQLIDVAANEFIRMLDVFATLGAPAGDYQNIRASFESIVPFSGGNPVNFIAACTVQNSTSFDADFRIGKAHS